MSRCRDVFDRSASLSKSYELLLDDFLVLLGLLHFFFPHLVSLAHCLAPCRCVCRGNRLTGARNLWRTGRITSADCKVLAWKSGSQFPTAALNGLHDRAGVSIPDSAERQESPGIPGEFAWFGGSLSRAFLVFIQPRLRVQIPSSAFAGKAQALNLRSIHKVFQVAFAVPLRRPWRNSKRIAAIDAIAEGSGTATVIGRSSSWPNQATPSCTMPQCVR